MKEIVDSPKIFESNIRLQMLASLLETDLTYKRLKEICHCSDGNMATHTKKLINEDYIMMSKTFVNNKPQTTYRITQKGKDELHQYISTLYKFIQSEEENEEKNVISNKLNLNNNL